MSIDVPGIVPQRKNTMSLVAHRYELEQQRQAGREQQRLAIEREYWAIIRRELDGASHPSDRQQLDDAMDALGKSAQNLEHDKSDERNRRAATAKLQSNDEQRAMADELHSVQQQNKREAIKEINAILEGYSDERQWEGALYYLMPNDDVAKFGAYADRRDVRRGRHFDAHANIERRKEEHRKAREELAELRQKHPAMFA
jgi:hypothetical protein